MDLLARQGSAPQPINELPGTVGATTHSESQSGPVMDRRDFLRRFGKYAAATSIAVAGIYTADSVRQGFEVIGRMEDDIWPPSEPSLNFLGKETYHGQTSLGLFLGGFGDMHSDTEAAEWKQSGKLPAELLTAYFDYSSHGASMDEIVGVIREKVDTRKLEELILFGSSMGGLYGVEVARRLGVPVKSFMMCSSPSSFQNAYFPNLSNLASKVPTNRTLATLAKFAANTYRTHQYEDTDLGQSLRAGMSQTLRGASPLALQNELKTARSINIFDPALLPSLQRVFIPGFTHVAYAATYQPYSDETVDVVASGQDFKYLFSNKLGVGFVLFGVKYDGHANVQATVIGTRSWTEAASTISG